jgi:hypothetical protein
MEDRHEFTTTDGLLQSERSCERFMVMGLPKTANLQDYFWIFVDGCFLP